MISDCGLRIAERCRAQGAGKLVNSSIRQMVKSLIRRNLRSRKSRSNRSYDYGLLLTAYCLPKVKKLREWALKV